MWLISIKNKHIGEFMRCCAVCWQQLFSTFITDQTSRWIMICSRSVSVGNIINITISCSPASNYCLCELCILFTLRLNSDNPIDNTTPDSKTIAHMIKISPRTYDSVWMFIWLLFQRVSSCSVSPQTTNSSWPAFQVYSIILLQSLKPLIEIDNLTWGSSPSQPHWGAGPAAYTPPSEQRASGRDRADQERKGGKKAEHRRREYGRSTLNSVRARGPTGTLIKYLDIFIDKLLISVLISLGKTDNFIFLSGGGMKGGGALSGV